MINVRYVHKLRRGRSAFFWVLSRGDDNDILKAKKNNNKKTKLKQAKQTHAKDTITP